MSSAAQDEVDRLFNQKEHFSSHPEDRQQTDSHSDSDNLSDDHHAGNSDSDDLDDTAFNKTGNMGTTTATQTYHLPTQTFDANTGPKGVIADARSFDQARKRSFRRTLMDLAQGASGTGTSWMSKKDTAAPTGSAENSASEDEDEFLRRWRENRMRELQNGSRRRSPSKRKFGRLDNVDAVGYLDAIEKVAADTIVVVLIFDPESNESNVVEDCLTSLARKHATTRFVKLHHEIAEMDEVQAPAILAYKGGDVISTIVNIFKSLPGGRDCSQASLEDLLYQHKIL